MGQLHVTSDMTIRPSSLFPAACAAVLLAVWALSPVTSPVAHAQSAAPAIVCYTFSHDLRAGTQDTGISTDVDSLQHFLSTEGYFSASNFGTGHFGPLTFHAVQQFQAAQGVPATGYVGPLTRAAIAKAQPSCKFATQAATLYAVTPTQGPVGTQVSIRGFGFSGSNTILVDGLVAARNVPITSSIAIACTTDPSCHGGINQTITFTLPGSVSPNCPVGSLCPMFIRELTPGTVTITVQNGGGTSNGLPFTITQ